MIFNPKYFISFLALVAFSAPAAARVNVIKPSPGGPWETGAYEYVMWVADGIDLTANFEAYLVSTDPNADPPAILIAPNQAGSNFEFSLNVPDVTPGEYQILFVEVLGNDNTYRSQPFHIV